jgi:hypothetical protein
MKTFLNRLPESRGILIPESVWIHISEYNPEHRQHTKALKRELFSIIYTPCRICGAPFNCEFSPIDYFILKKYKLNCHWCSLECFQKDPDTSLKVRCLHAVEEYVEN